MNNSERIMRLCSFYVSDWHLITMLLPYINKQINEGTKVATILENDIENNVKTLVEKLNLENKEKILNINWKNKNTNKNLNISKIIEDNLGKNILIIVNGKKDFIKNANRSINKHIYANINKMEETNTNIKIVDAYEIIEFNGSIVEILDNHDKMLNTSGEKEINEIFEDYNKKDVDENKKIG